MAVDWLVALGSLVLLLAVTVSILILTAGGAREKGLEPPERPDRERDASDEEKSRAA